MAFTMNRGKKDILDRYIAGAEFRLMLVQAAPASAAAAADLNTVSDVAAAEATFTNYARRTLASVATVEDDTADLARLTAANPAAYTAAGGATNNTVAGAYVFRRGTNGVDTPASDPLVAFLDMADLTTNGGDLTVTLSPNGILTVA
jgi:hypothetical protein